MEQRGGWYTRNNVTLVEFDVFVILRPVKVLTLHLIPNIRFGIKKVNLTCHECEIVDKAHQS